MPCFLEMFEQQHVFTSEVLLQVKRADLSGKHSLIEDGKGRVCQNTHTRYCSFIVL